MLGRNDTVSLSFLRNKDRPGLKHPNLKNYQLKATTRVRRLEGGVRIPVLVTRDHDKLFYFLCTYTSDLKETDA
jgi:hypothetical protein